MGIPKITAWWACILPALCFSYSNETPEGNRILYMAQIGKIAEALKLYQHNVSSYHQHDYELLQKIGLHLLNEGISSRDVETNLMAMFGAGISGNENTLHILEAGLKHKNPQIQLIALNMLARYQNSQSDQAICQAMGAYHPLVKLEAIFILAKKKHPKTSGFAEAFMYRYPKSLAVFGEIFAKLADKSSVTTLKKLLSNQDEKTRISTILTIAEHERDDLLSEIRMLSSHPNPMQQEACAYALGLLKDEASIPRLEKLSASGIPSVQLAARLALYRLGKREQKRVIEEMARKGNVCAVGALSAMEGTEHCLYELLVNTDTQIRANAVLALLEKQDPKCLQGLGEILVYNPQKDIAFSRSRSSGLSFTYWKILTSAKHHLSQDPLQVELFIHEREAILQKASQLPEKDFIAVANMIIAYNQSDLIPATVKLLEELQTESAINLLKYYQQQIGNPLIRNYCSLALYRLQEPGNYAEVLLEWLSSAQNSSLIQFRPLLTREIGSSEEHALQPQEVSRLLVESFEAFANSRDQVGIEALIYAILYGNQKNKYALAGLLMRATQ